MLVDDAQIERRAAEEPQILLLAKEEHLVILRGHQIRVVLILIAYVLEHDDLRSVKQMVAIKRAEIRSCIRPKGNDSDTDTASEINGRNGNDLEIDQYTVSCIKSCT